MIDIFVKHLGESTKYFLPETVLLITFILALIFDLIFKKSKNISAYIAIVGFIVTAVFLFLQPDKVAGVFSYSYAVDGFSRFIKFVILATSFIIVIISLFSKELYESHKKIEEYFTLIVGMTFGMFLLTGATNLILIYVAIETMSISSYILAGYTKEVKRSSEASLKYVIYGAVSSGIMIYGISLLYGLTGHLNIFQVFIYLANNQVNEILLSISGIMLIAGIGYKISAVPFHFWTPDVYEGAPVTITALLSVASKAAGFAVLIRIVLSCLPAKIFRVEFLSSFDWQFILAIISVLTMTIGNLLAVWQTNLKRLLAYSSIAHAGYILMGIVVLNAAGISAVLIYLVVYMFMNLGAFYYVMLIANKINSEDIDDYTGIGYRAPLLGVCMAIFLVSLTGLPPTAGFIGKLYIFTALFEEGSRWVWLAVVGILNSVISLYYYVKVFRNMFVRGVDLNKEKLEFSAPSVIIMILITIPTLLFGIWFSPLISWAESSFKFFFP